ncbi:MAG TPA: hypothetical protein VIV06_04910 [Candidatus Limnocylindrales bacterium]
MLESDEGGRTSQVVPTSDRSMRWLEYGVAAAAAIVALVLAFLR